MRPFRRRNYYIDKKFQNKYLLITIALLAVYTLIFVIVLFYPSIASLYSTATPPEQLEASRTLLLLHTKVWPAIGIAILILAGLSIFVSHKIAGPIYRIRTALTEISSGDLTTRIKLRKGDDLRDVAEQVNQLKEELQTFMQTLKMQHGELSQQIDELERNSPKDWAKDKGVGDVLLRLNQNKERMAATLKKFSPAELPQP